MVKYRKGEIMKKILMGFTTLALLSLTFGGVVNAQQTNDTTTTSNEQTQTVEDKYKVQDKSAEDFKKNLEERIKARKEELKTNLNTAKQAKIKTKCQSSQSLINKVSEKASAAKTSRDEIYNNVTKNATKLSDRLKENGQDTTELDSSIAELNTLIENFKTDLKDMRQAAQDLSDMDCKTDPSGFYTSLEELRASRELVAQDSAAIRDYIKNTLKPLLQEIRTNIGQTNQTTQGAN